MKHIIYIVFVTISVQLCGQTNNKEVNFNKTLEKIVTAFSKKDSVGLSKYIDKNTGIYVIWKPEVFNTYVHAIGVSFNDTILPTCNRGCKSVELTSLKYEKLPTFLLYQKNSPGILSLKWSKKG